MNRRDFTKSAVGVGATAVGQVNRRQFVATSAGLAAASASAETSQPSPQTRPIIAMDIKLKHQRDSNTGAVIGPDEYLTDFAYRDEYKIYNRYVDQVFETGGLPLLVPCFTGEAILKQYVSMADGFLFVGINDYPPELYREPKRIETQVQNTVGYRQLAESNMILARLVLKGHVRMPVLGICAGPQLCTIALGGKLIQHVPNPQHHIAHSHIRDKEHAIRITSGRILKGLFGAGPIVVNTNHHQAADTGHMGEGLRAVAFAEDGVVEAIEGTDPDRFLLGVQWHPERMRDNSHRDKLFGAFVAAAHTYRRMK